jgi:MoxR-like ATPase
MFEERMNLEPVRESIQQVKNEIGKIIVGQENLVELMLTALLANGHVLLEGFPGLAKTLSAKILAKTISSDFKRIQFTPDLMPSDVLGTAVFNLQNSEFEYKKGPIFTNIVLIDEINRAPAKTQAALFEVMEERQVSAEGITYSMAKPFIIIATQNPIDMEGTYRLPEAQMDRFMFKIVVDYPNLEQEVEILNRYHSKKNSIDLESIAETLTETKIEEHQNLVKGVVVEPKLIQYIAEIVNKTRSYRDIQIGASPRASLALLSGAKALAVIRGRDFITPDDINDLTGPVLNHRISLSPEKEMEGVSPNAIVEALVKSIEIPR